MSKRFLISLFTVIACLFVSCSMDPADDTDMPTESGSGDRLLVLCEGLWGLDNSTISYVDNGVLTNGWFKQQNPGMHLGDTGNDIIQVNDTLIAVSVNWSNIIQYMYPDGKAIAATEDIPNNRRLATDGERYLFCTSYANKGYVAKVDLVTKQIVSTCKVGYEPEGIAYYEGKLFIANTGGYSFQEKDHQYESTISVVDAESMQELRRIDVGCVNLYGTMSQCGQFVCINSAGDYYDIKPKTVVLDMSTEEFRVYDFPATYNCVYENRFYVIGSEFSYSSGSDGDYKYSVHSIDLPSMKEYEGFGKYNFAVETIMQMQSPYCIYISPYSGHLYVTDARSYATNGYLYEFDPDTEKITKLKLQGLNPGHVVALSRTSYTPGK